MVTPLQEHRPRERRRITSKRPQQCFRGPRPDPPGFDAPRLSDQRVRSQFDYHAIASAAGDLWVGNATAACNRLRTAGGSTFVLPVLGGMIAACFRVPSTRLPQLSPVLRSWWLAVPRVTTTRTPHTKSCFNPLGSVLLRSRSAATKPRSSCRRVLRWTYRP